MNNHPSADAALEDGELVGRLARGDEGALEVLYDRLSGRLFSLAVAITGDESASEELISDAFLHLWTHAGGFDPERGSLRAWATSIVRSRALDVRRKASRRTRITMDQGDSIARFSVGDGSPDPVARAVARADLAGALSAELEGMADEQRRAIELAYFGGLTQSEIAETTGAPLGTVKTRIRTGMKRLRDVAHSSGIIVRGAGV